MDYHTSVFPPCFPGRHRPRHSELPDGDPGDAGCAAGYSDGPHSLLCGGRRGAGEGREGQEQLWLLGGADATDPAAVVWLYSAAGGG